jgi:hypothetical protein
MRYRVLAVSLPLVLALTLIVLSPASAGPRTATTTITDHGDCSFTVTYEWSGFPGTGLVAQVALGYRDEVWGLNSVFASADFPEEAGSPGNSVSAKFTLSGVPTDEHPYFGRGALLAPAKKGPYTLSSVRGSVVYSGDTDSQACGSIVTVTAETSLP